MQHFPIFVAMKNARVIVSGGGAAALAKLRLLLKTPADIHVFSADPATEIRAWHREGQLHLIEREVQAADITGATLVYAADEEANAEARVKHLAHGAGVLVNVVDNLDASDFITPAMVDRAPVTVAIGTEGTAPVLARKIKASLEETLPAATGALAIAAASFRGQAEVLPHGEARRSFWSDWFERAGPRAKLENVDLGKALSDLLHAHIQDQSRPDRVTLAWTGSDDPDLLVMKTRRALDQADVVVHSTGISPQVLELARREADFIALHSTATVPPLPRLLAQRAKGGRHVLYLSDRPIDLSLAPAIRAAGVEVTEIPGLAEPFIPQKQEQA